MRRCESILGFTPRERTTPIAAAALCLRVARVLRLKGDLETARLAVVDARHLRLKMLGKVAEQKYKRSNGNPLECPFCTAQYESTSSMERHVLTHGE